MKLNALAIQGILEKSIGVEEVEEKRERKHYPNLKARYHELSKIVREAQNEDEKMEAMMEDDSLCHVMECDGISTYVSILRHAKQLNGKRVIDIGCAYGHQSEVFVDSGVEYVGVTNHDSPFFNRDRFDYIIGKYPCELPLQSGDIGVSVLCLTWNVYLTEGEKTLHEQYEALKRDFADCILYLPAHAVEVVSGYFSEATRLEHNLYHFKR